VPNCQIQDAYGYWAAAGTFTGVENAIVYAVPDASWRTYDVSGTYRPLGANPDILTAAYQRGRRTATTTGGVWSFSLPYSTSSYPTTPTAEWSIVLPTGDIWTGVVPAVAGPLTIKELEESHGWTPSGTVEVAPVTPGTLIRGTATFAAATTVSVLFSVPFASSAYNIKLSPSADTVSGGIPVVAWTNRTTSGFDIVASGVTTCSVCYEAVL